MPLAEVVGRNANLLRGDATADEVATAARNHGLNWGTGRISDLEHGRVSPTLPTLVVLAGALGEVRGQPVTLADMVRHDGFIALTSDLVLHSDALQRYLGGSPVEIKASDIIDFQSIAKKIKQAAAQLAKLLPELGKVKTREAQSVERQSGPRTG
jgi:hypothetical protein